MSRSRPLIILSTLFLAVAVLIFQGAMAAPVSGGTEYGQPPVGGPPQVSLNHEIGAPDSVFTLSGANFPPNSDVSIDANSHELGAVTTDETGSFVVLLTTEEAHAGLYVLMVRGTRGATSAMLLLDPDEPVRAQEGEGPALAIPAGIGVAEAWVTAPVPVEGGVIRSPRDNTSHTFPPNAFTDTVRITHTVRMPASVPPPTAALTATNHFYEITAVFSDTGRPAQPAPGQRYTVTINYTDEEIVGVVEETLALYVWDGAEWIEEPTSRVDIANNILTATPSHFSYWGMLGETGAEVRRIFLPVIRR